MKNIIAFEVNDENYEKFTKLSDICKSGEECFSVMLNALEEYVKEKYIVIEDVNEELYNRFIELSKSFESEGECLKTMINILQKYCENQKLH